MKVFWLAVGRKYRQKRLTIRRTSAMSPTANASYTPALEGDDTANDKSEIVLPLIAVPMLTTNGLYLGDCQAN